MIIREMNVRMVEVKYEFYNDAILVQRQGKGEPYNRVSREINWERDLGTILFKSDVIQLLEFDHPTMIGKGAYENADGYIFINHSKGIAFESIDCTSHLQSNLETCMSEDDTNEIIDLFFKD